MSTGTKAALAVGLPLLILGLTELAAWDGGYFQLYYVLPLALLVPWLIILRYADGPPGHRLLAFDLAAMALAGVRIIGPFLPMSGHALFLVYTGITLPHRWYRLAATVVFLEVTYLKVVAWHETRSFVGGVVGGTVLAMIARGWARRGAG